MSLWELPKQRLSVIASPHFSPRDVPGLHGSTARAPGTQLCSRPRSSGQGRFRGRLLRLGWLVGGLPPALPTLGLSTGQPVAREQGPGQAIGPPRWAGTHHPDPDGMVAPTWPSPDTPALVLSYGMG